MTDGQPIIMLPKDGKPVGDKLLTSADLAEEIKKPEKTLAMWRWQGIGPRYIKVGRDVRYRRRDVERWLDEQTVATH